MGAAYEHLKADLGECDSIPFTNSTGSELTGGTIQELNAKVGLLYDDVEDGESTPLITGIPTPGGMVPKTSGEAQNKGEALYYDTNNTEFTTTSANGTEAGYVYADAASSDDRVQAVLTDLNV